MHISQYYQNKMWRDQSCTDAWCKQCYAKQCTSEGKVKEYFRNNNRKYNEKIWHAAMNKAQVSLSATARYVRGDQQQRQKMLLQTTIKMVPTFMNNKSYYEYYDYLRRGQRDQEQCVDKVQNKQIQQLIYSPVWRGRFTQEQIDSLDAMYQEYEKDYDVSTVNRRDSIRKLIKASFDYDVARQRLVHGQITVAQFEKYSKIFDELSKSSATSEVSRRAGSSTGLSSLGNIILGLQINHHLDNNPFTFPPDDVDKIYADYAHLAAAVGAQL